MVKIIYFVTVFLLYTLYSFSDNKTSKNEENSILQELLNLKTSDRVNLQFDTRFDYTQDWNQSGLAQNKFGIHTFRIVLFGEITNKLKYRFRHRLNKSNLPDNSNFAKATDLAFLQYAINDHLSIRAGKMLTQFGTFEFNYTSSNIFISTLCNRDLPTYSTGLNLAFSAANQRLNLQIVNSEENQFAAPDYKNKALAALILWEGNLFKNLLKTRYGFGMFQHNGNTAYNWLTLGTQINIKSFTTELDVFKGRRIINLDNIFNSETLGSQLVHDLSFAANLKYRIKKFVPQLKFVWDERKDKANNGDYHSKKLQTAIEYFPYSTGNLSNLSFHLVYGYTYTNYNGTFKEYQSTQQNSTIILGFRFLIDII